MRKLIKAAREIAKVGRAMAKVPGWALLPGGGLVLHPGALANLREIDEIMTQVAAEIVSTTGITAKQVEYVRRRTAVIVHPVFRIEVKAGNFYASSRWYGGRIPGAEFGVIDIAGANDKWAEKLASQLQRTWRQRLGIVAKTPSAQVAA